MPDSSPKSPCVPLVVKAPHSRRLETLKLVRAMKGGRHSEKERDKRMYHAGYTPQLWCISKEKLCSTKSCCECVLSPIRTAPYNRENILWRSTAGVLLDGWNHSSALRLGTRHWEKEQNNQKTGIICPYLSEEIWTKSHQVPASLIWFHDSKSRKTVCHN